MKINSQLKAVVVGSGVVGFATGKGIEEKGKEVNFIDINPIRIQKLRSQGFQAFTNSKLKYSECTCDLILLSVPTPTVNKKIDLSFLRAASNDVGEHLRNTDQYHVVVVRSTVPPGTTENIVINTIEEISGKKVGKDFGVCMNPEYLREKTAEKDFANPWIILIGEYDQKSGDTLAEIYQGFSAPLHRVSLREAEVQKYIHNLYNATKISFFNEFRQICKKIGADPERIFPIVAASTEGIWNPNYGLADYGPFSGMCLPKDTQAFFAWAESLGWEMPLLEATIEVNERLIKQNGYQKQEQGVQKTENLVYGV